MIFVFGANTQFYHGAGAAAYAVEHHGAIMGKGGLQGSSYALPTVNYKKGWGLSTMSIPDIKNNVDVFLEFAKNHPLLQFQVTAIATGLASHRHSEIAPLFTDAPNNCLFDNVWKEYLGEDKKYWGTYG